MTRRLVYLTPQETAAVLRVHKATIYRWVKANKIPYERLPSGDVRINEDDLRDWLASRHRAVH